jgi:hypothetical protein
MKVRKQRLALWWCCVISSAQSAYNANTVLHAYNVLHADNVLSTGTDNGTYIISAELEVSANNGPANSGSNVPHCHKRRTTGLIPPRNVAETGYHRGPASSSVT